MLLDNKTAVIHGGGGSIGGAVARASPASGARVFFAGRAQATLEDVAEAIRAAGRAVETAKVDALDRISLPVEAGRSELSPHATRGDPCPRPFSTCP
jgi:NADP-dependent 3-hydroxy acid dehydrogenase YdfG